MFLKHRKKSKFEVNLIWSHPITTWTIFYSFLTPTPLEWTKLDILHTIYPLSHNPQGLLNAPLQLLESHQITVLKNKSPRRISRSQILEQMIV